MTVRIAATILLLAAAAAPAQAQAQAQGPLHAALGAPGRLKLGGSVRTRYEVLQGQVRPGFNEEDDLFSVRSILSAEYDAGPVRIGAELYDSRAYGADEGTPIGTGEVNTFELVQAYVAADFDVGAGGRGTLQAGRFTLNLGSRRLVAADDYRNTTNGYTGIRGDISPSKSLSATIFYVLPQVRLPDDLPSILDNGTAWDREGFDLSLWGAFIKHGGLIPGVAVEPYYVGFNERDADGRPTRDRNLHNLGLRIVREPATSKADFEAEAIYQFGRTSTGLTEAAARTDVSATFFHLEAGYSFAAAWKPRLSIEFDRASGDGPGEDYGRFDTLYGMRRADLAPAGLYAALGRTNISSPGIRLEAAPGGGTDVFAAYRLLWAAEETDSFSTTGVRDPSGMSGSFAGHQLDARLRHWIFPQRLRAEANATWLLKRGLLQSAPSSLEARDTIYLSVATTLTL